MEVQVLLPNGQWKNGIINMIDKTQSIKFNSNFCINGVLIGLFNFYIRCGIKEASMLKKFVIIDKYKGFIDFDESNGLLSKQSEISESDGVDIENVLLNILDIWYFYKQKEIRFNLGDSDYMLCVFENDIMIKQKL